MKKSKVDMTMKFGLLGDEGTGKTTLFNLICKSKFQRDFQMSVGMNVGRGNIIIDGKLIRLSLLDFAPKEEMQEGRFIGVIHETFKHIHGLLFIFDISNRESFENIESFVEEVMSVNLWHLTCFMLLANKVDLRNTTEACISREEAEKYAKFLSEKLNRDVPYFEISAITGENVDTALETLGRMVMKRVAKNNDESSL